jgi:hypothetical protein
VYPASLDPATVEWLAAQTHTDARQVRDELELGSRRRVFVVDELLDAGFTGRALLEGVVRLTALGADDARTLIETRRSANS